MSKRSRYFKEGQSSEEQEKQAASLIQAKFDAEKKQKWARQLQSEYGVGRNRPKRSHLKRRLLWIGSAAAAILVLFAITGDWLTFNDSPTPQQFAQAYLEESPFPYAGARKSMETIADMRQEAIDGYQTNNFKKAIAAWEALNAEGAANTEDKFYLGLSYLYNENPEKAIDTFNDMPGTNHPFQQEQKWFLGLAYLQNGQTALAKDLFLSIKPKEWNYASAQQLLKSL
jgi:hypothetical protein